MLDHGINASCNLVPTYCKQSKRWHLITHLNSSYNNSQLGGGTLPGPGSSKISETESWDSCLYGGKAEPAGSLELLNDWFEREFLREENSRLFAFAGL